MRPGDVILQIDRHDVDSAHAAAAVLAKATPPILLLVKRGESTVFLTLTPGKAMSVDGGRIGGPTSGVGRAEVYSSDAASRATGPAARACRSGRGAELPSIRRSRRPAAFEVPVGEPEVEAGVELIRVEHERAPEGRGRLVLEADAAEERAVRTLPPALGDRKRQCTTQRRRRRRIRRLPPRLADVRERDQGTLAHLAVRLVARNEHRRDLVVIHHRPAVALGQVVHERQAIRPAVVEERVVERVRSDRRSATSPADPSPGSSSRTRSPGTPRDGRRRRPSRPDGST